MHLSEISSDGQAAQDQFDRTAVVQRLLSDLEGAGHDLRQLGRVRALLEVWSGKCKAQCRPLQVAKDDVFMPELENDTPWLDTDSFAVAALMREKFGELQEEARRLQTMELLSPYGVDPLNSAPNDNPAGWRMYQLLNNSELDDAARQVAPVAASIAKCALQDHSYVSQVAYLELGPGEELPEHVDYANFLVSCHLGLIIPEECGLRVAGEDRKWVEGQCLAFNNSYLHAAYNHGGNVRVVLAVHGLHPSLSRNEKDALRFVLRSFGM